MKKESIPTKDKRWNASNHPTPSPSERKRETMQSLTLRNVKHMICLRTTKLRIQSYKRI